MSPALALVLTFIALAVLLAVAVYYGFRFLDSWLDELFPPSAEEVSRRQAEARSKQATKEFKQRQRLRTIRFWNF